MYDESPYIVVSKMFEKSSDTKKVSDYFCNFANSFTKQEKIIDNGHYKMKTNSPSGSIKIVVNKEMDDFTM